MYIRSRVIQQFPPKKSFIQQQTVTNMIRVLNLLFPKHNNPPIASFIWVALFHKYNKGTFRVTRKIKRSIMEEHAKEELKLLEAQYPNQHEHLKNELRSFIFQLQTNHQDSEQLPENNNFSTHLAFFDTEGFSLLFSSFFYFVMQRVFLFLKNVNS